MSRLVEELKKEHATLVGALDEVNRNGFNTPEGQQALALAKAGLLAHLKKEDTQLYPELNKAAEKDASLRRTLDMFAKDMSDISAFALDFFKKYAQGGSGMDFAKDYGKLTGSLRNRIQREESILYKEYDKLVTV